MGFNLDDYEPVANRIERFWEDHPDGRIISELVAADAGVYRMRTLVWRDQEDLDPAVTGWAQESEAATPSNMKSSVVEILETSAIGRALANLGYQTHKDGGEVVRPSREEMMAAAKTKVEEQRAKLKAAPPRPAADTNS